MRPCDPHGNGGGSDSRITSLTLSASGEFLGYFGGEKRDPINSIHWEEVERGLDLKGTEKGILDGEEMIVACACVIVSI